MRTDVTELFRHDGPFATVYLTSRSDIPQAAQELEQRWKSVRSSLAAQGAPDETLAALDGAVSSTNHAAGDTLALVAAGGDVLLHWHLPEPPRVDVGWWSSVPRVATVLEADQTMLPHLVVLCDRTGADVYGFTASGRAVEREIEGTNADDVKLFQAGGWSQRRYQQRQVNTWEDNAHEVADEVARLAKRTDARLIAIGGDVHAKRFVCEALPKEMQGLVRDIEGGSRHPDGGTDHVAEDVKRLVDTVVASETVAVLEEFKEERGQHDRAADGPARVVEALQRAQVRTLLVHDDLEDDRTIWFGPEPLHVGLDEAAVKAMGVDEPWEARAIDVCIRAAIGSGADVRVVPMSVLDRNLGAVLRY
ncbi:MAG TPA: Vms1/Ankzf1 family peptidyl-tRNA hydrolase [Acidimicrobiales bacterium]|nr:Vms1/Ankzf1 family peptidyl-tRNA hydrolase [Acidimicrobiales bacterium]